MMMKLLLAVVCICQRDGLQHTRSTPEAEGDTRADVKGDSEGDTARGQGHVYRIPAACGWYGHSLLHFCNVFPAAGNKVSSDTYARHYITSAGNQWLPAPDSHPW